MPTPEQRARQNIDELLQQCGWIVQSRSEMNLGAVRGIAVREFPLKTGYADYLLFVDRRAIEAKAEGATLTGVETFFTNGLDPEPRSRRTFAFHRSETLAYYRHDAALAAIRRYIQDNPLHWIEDRDNLDNVRHWPLPAKVEDYLEDIRLLLQE